MEGKGGEGGNASIYAYNAREREKIARLLVSRRIFLLDHARFVSQSYVHLSLSFFLPSAGFLEACYKEGEIEERKGKLLIRTGAKWISRRARRSREMIATRFPPMKFWTNFSGLLG